jgi:filamentous hemagglutinin
LSAIPATGALGKMATGGKAARTAAVPGSVGSVIDDVARAGVPMPTTTLYQAVRPTPETPTVNWGAITDAEASGYSVYDKFKTTDGTNWNWPSNLGFEGSVTHEVLPVGTLLDRYGNPTGSFMSPYGLSYESRALPPGSMAGGYYVYEVVLPLPVKSGSIAPAFGQPGGGTQLLPDFPTRVNVEWLINEGYLKVKELH